MAATSIATQLADQLMHELRAKGTTPTRSWLISFLSSYKTAPPLVTLVATANFRLLATDIKQSLDINKNQVFRSDMVNASMKEARLTGPIVVQILDVEDMSRSRWGQIEEIEAEERGERTKGREIIRVAPGTDEDNPQATGSKPASNGPHKLLVEDSKGAKVYAIEQKRVKGVDLHMNIGSKMLLRDVVVARGVLLLDPSNATVIGGKIDHLHQHWNTNRKKQLKASVENTQPTV